MNITVGIYPLDLMRSKLSESVNVLHKTQDKNPEVCFLWGTELSIGDPIKLQGDHAAREEISYGLSVMPELVQMDALRPGHDMSVWPNRKAPEPENRHPGVCFDPAEPLFAQLGEDARKATAERGEKTISQLVKQMTKVISARL